MIKLLLAAKISGGWIKILQVTSQVEWEMIPEERKNEKTAVEKMTS